MIKTTKDDRVLDELTRKRDSLYIAQYLFDLNHAFREFLSRESDYRASASVSAERMRAYLGRYLRDNHLTAQDPWNGTLSLDEHGAIVTTTPHEPVFGLK